MDYVENTHETTERLKRLWKKYGNLVVTLILLIMVIIVGLQAWHKHKVKVAIQASALYDNLLVNLEAQKNAQVKGLANQLLNNYASSPYAELAVLLLAKQAITNKQLSLATTNLQWVIEHAKSSSIKAIAQIRLARVWLAEKKAAQALSLVQQVRTVNMLSIASVVKGDAYLQLKKVAQAKLAYQQALKAMAPNEPLYAYTQMKLYSL